MQIYIFKITLLVIDVIFQRLEQFMQLFYQIIQVGTNIYIYTKKRLLPVK